MLIAIGDPNYVSKEHVDLVRAEVSRVFPNAYVYWENYGGGADVPVAEILLGISTIFLLGKRIDENLDAWLAIGKKVGRLINQLEVKFKRTPLIDENAALLIAMTHLIEDEAVSSIEILSDARIATRGFWSDPTAETFRNRSEVAYVYTTRINNTYFRVLIIDSTRGDILMDYTTPPLEFPQFPAKNVNIAVLRDYSGFGIPQSIPRQSEYKIKVPSGITYETLITLIQAQDEFPNFVIYSGTKIDFPSYIFYEPSNYNLLRMARTEEEFENILDKDNGTYEAPSNGNVIERDTLLVLTPHIGYGGGGGILETVLSDPSSFIGTLTGIFSLLVSIAQYLQSKQQDDSKLPVKQIIDITVIMSNGDRISVTDWPADRIVEFVKSFSQSRATTQPERVHISFNDGTQTKLYVSTETDRDNFEKFAMFLGIPLGT